MGWQSLDMRKNVPIVQYLCALLLIITSIALVSYQVLTISDVSDGLLMYIAQAFLLAGSIFGLDYYVLLINKKLKNALENSERNTQQQSSEHKDRQ